MFPPQTAVSIDCFVRASTLAAPVDGVVRTLREYHRSGTIDELTVRAWPDEVPLAGGAEDPDAITRYRLFRAWADEHDVDLEPAFARRDRTTLVSDGTEPVLVLPVMCLAVHVDGELTAVVPHRDGETTYSVGDALADLEGRAPGPSPDARGSDRCPACGSEVVTGQGLYACPACSWTDVEGIEVAADVGANDGDDRSGADETVESPAEDADDPRPRPP